MGKSPKPLYNQKPSPKTYRGWLFELERLENFLTREAFFVHYLGQKWWDNNKVFTLQRIQYLKDHPRFPRYTKTGEKR